MSPDHDPRLTSPATARNRDAILGVLRTHLGAGAKVLEIASGAGEHAAYFAARLTAPIWQPSDPNPVARASIAGWTAGNANVLAPLDLDVQDWRWWQAVPDPPFDALIAINLIHIAPWAATEGLMAGAARLLGPAGCLILYGPFRRDGRHTAPSNAAFDRDLRGTDPNWGIRDLADVARLAAKSAMILAQAVAMPANNLTVVFQRQERAP